MSLSVLRLSFRKALSLISEPKTAIAELQHETLERAVRDFIYLIISFGLFGGLFFFLFSIGKAFYLQVFF